MLSPRMKMKPRVVHPIASTIAADSTSLRNDVSKGAQCLVIIIPEMQLGL